MAYNTSKGDRQLGDIKNEDDVDTQIDWDDDYIGLKTGGTTRLVISGSVVGIGTTTPDTAAMLNISKDVDSEFIALKLTNESDAADTTGKVSLQFDLEDSAGTAVDAGKITVEKESGYTSDPPTQDSSMVFDTSLNGTLGTSMTLDSQSKLTIEGEIEVKKDSSFGATGQSRYFTVKSTGNASMLRVDGAQDYVGIGLASPTHTLTVAGAISGSSTIYAASSISSSLNLAVTGAVHANTYYGDGSNLSGISLGVGSATSTIVSGMLTASQGTYIADNRSASFGDGGDFRIRHDSTNTKLTNATGHVLIDNQATSKDIRFILGSDSAATEAVKIRNNSDNSVWVCDAAGNVSGSGKLEAVGNAFIVGNLNVTGSTLLGVGSATSTIVSGMLTASQGMYLADNRSASFGDGGDFSIEHNGTNSKIDNLTGHLIIDNKATSKDIRFVLGSDSAATEAVKIRNNSNDNVWICDAAGNVSGSGKLEAVGNAFVVGNLNVTGNIDTAADLTAATITMTGFTVDADGDTNLKALRVDDGSFIGCDSDTDLMRLSTNTLQINGTLSGSSIIYAASSISSSLNLAVTGAVHANTYYGDGSNLSGISAGAVNTYTNASNNRIITSVDSNTINGESNLTFDGTNLSLAGNISGSNNIQISSGSFNGDLAVSGTIRGRQISVTRHYYENGSNSNFRWINFMNATEAQVGSATYQNSMVAPFNGRLVRVLSKFEDSQNGNVIVSIATGSGLTVASEPSVEEITVSMIDAANAVGVFNTTGSSHFTAGSLVGIGVNPNANPGRVSISCIWEYDIFGL